MRISDWSSDVCSSDLIVAVEEALALARVHQPQRWRFARSGDEQGKAIVDHRGSPNVSAKLLHLEGSEFLLEKGVPAVVTSGHLRAESHVDKPLKAPLRIATVAYRKPGPEIGRASCRDRVCQYV